MAILDVEHRINLQMTAKEMRYYADLIELKEQDAVLGKSQYIDVIAEGKNYAIFLFAKREIT